MYLSKLQLWNFRKFGSSDDLIVENELRKPDLSVNFSKGINVLIGENDSGKTAIIDAIKLILKTHSSEWISLSHDDFFETSTRLRIECRFDDLSSDEAKNFTEWLGAENEGEEASVYLKVILGVQRKNDRIISFDIKAGADNEGYALTAEAREYLKTIYLKPLRDAKGELIPKKNSRLSQILQGHKVFKGKNDDHELVADVYREFCEKVEHYFKKGEGGEEIKTTLDGFLEQFFGEEKESKFTITEQKLKNILETLRLTLEDGKLGLGSHNLLFIASELLNLKRTGWNGIRLGLIEELEAHLHPQAQLRVIDSLQNKDDVQFILTTHSPNLTSKVKLKNLIMCSDDANNTSTVFPMGAGNTKLEEVDYKFLEKFLDVTKANLFFAKGVILVEGWSEEILIPALARKIKVNLTEKGVSIVNVRGTAFHRYAKIFQRNSAPLMKIPVSIVTDLDVLPIHVQTKSAKKISSEIETRKSAVNYANEPVKIYFSQEWTLEYCLLKSSSLGSSFRKAFKKVHPRINEEDAENELVKKLRSGGLNKTEIAYQLAQVINEDSVRERPEISINEKDEYIKYLIKAIRYASSRH